jgi:hypothetical protein
LIPFHKKNLSSPKERCFSQGVIMRKGGIFETVQAALIVASLLFLGCDLLNNKPEIDLETAMDAEIAWANAARLTVTVEYSSDWGYSPQRGTGKAGDTRLGFAFTVEFTPAAEYGFERWIAVRNGDYNAANPGATDLSKDLNGNGVHITEDMSDTGAYIASVTISITEGITLIPLCTDRPKVRESNPPLTASPNPFPYDQKISLWFNMPIRDVQLGQEGSIRINAVRTSGINDMGDISPYFAASLEEDNTRVDLTVIDDISHPATDLGQLVITVTAGPGIESRRGDGGAGLPMVSAQSLTYITGSEAGQKVYESRNVQAARAAGGTYFQNSGIDWRDYTTDRRFNKTDKKTAYIKFTAQNPADELRPPDSFIVVERLYLDLGGFPLSGSVERGYRLTDPELSQTGSWYTIAHELQTASSGIIQLIILPWLDDASGYDAADPMNALAAVPPQYVTVVLDNAAPGLNNPQALLTGHASEAGGLYTYGENSSLTLTVGRMAYLSDNAAEGGIADGEATGKPWTKDRLGDLQWRVVFESGSNSKRYESGWQNAAGNTYTVTNTQTLFNGTTLDTETAYEVKLQFKDRMGNVSALQSTGLRAEYSSRASMIANLGDLEAFRNMVNGGGVTAGKEYVLTDDILNVTNWTPIGTNANRFKGTFYGNGHRITITGITAAADMGLFGVVEGGTVQDVTVQYSGNVNPTGAFRFGGITGTAQGNARFENVQVSGSVTLGGSGSTAYAGGLAGLMSGTARITNAYSSLNLTVNTNPGTSNSLYVGGAAGSMGRPANGDAVTVEEVSIAGNITVGSQASPVNASGTANSTVGLFVGGLSGFIRGSGAGASNATLLDLEYRQGNIRVWSGDGVTILGGAIGKNYGYAAITGCSSLAGSFIIDKNSADVSQYYVGGFLGDFYQTGTMSNCYSDNQIVISGVSGFTGGVVGGGFAGRINAGVSVSYCYALGDVSATGYAAVYTGGFAGIINNGSSASYCYSAGDVYAYGKEVNVSGPYAGGFTGSAYDLTDCYALGNVFVDRSAGGLSVLYAGALVGMFNGLSGGNQTVEHCFAAGSVIAQRDSNGGIGAGGLAGYISSNSTLKNSAALGASVTITGLGTQYIGRVIGRAVSGFTAQNNYANNGMRLYRDADYGDGRPNEVTTLSPTPAAGNEHGADAHFGNFHNPTFWQTTLGFSAANWDFSTVALKGRPRLRISPNGAAMAGQ